MSIQVLSSAMRSASSAIHAPCAAATSGNRGFERLRIAEAADRQRRRGQPQQAEQGSRLHQ
jgi:hypothetical protein